MPHMLILPVKCKDCDAVFDLWHDLNQSELKKEDNREELINKAVKQSLCGKCREVIFEKIKKVMP